MLQTSKGQHGPLARYVKLWVAHAPGMPGTFSPPPRVSDPDIHHGTCGTHVPGFMPGSLTRGFLWSRWRGKRSRHSLRMRNSQLYASGKRPMAEAYLTIQQPTCLPEYDYSIQSDVTFVYLYIIRSLLAVSTWHIIQNSRRNLPFKALNFQMFSTSPDFMKIYPENVAVT